VSRCLILANPKAGRLRAALARLSRIAGKPTDALSAPDSLRFLHEAAERAGLNASVRIIPPRDRLPDLVAAARWEGYDTIVAVGGDSTISAVAQGLVGTSLRLGVLPMGTDNNIACALGLPFDLDAALRVIAEGEERCIEVGRIGGEYFLEGAGVGLFADAICAFGPAEPRKHEIFRVLKVMCPLCLTPRARRLLLTLDGVAQEEEALMVTAANIPFLGPNFELAPGAVLDDGLLDVVIVGALTWWELLRFGTALLRGRHLDLPKVRRVHARTVEIRRRFRAHHPLPVHADDHIAGYTPTRLEIVPAALRVLVPRAAPPSMSGSAVEERGAASPETAGVRSGAYGRT